MAELQDSSVKFLLMFMAAMEKSVPAPEQIIEKEQVHLIINGENNIVPKEKEDSSKMANEIIQLRNRCDRGLKLYGRLIVKKYYQENTMEFKWTEFQISSVGKPYYNGNKKFSISHSGDFVLVAFSDREIGTDIERVTDFDITSVISYLHPAEAKYIENALNPEATFFKVWTRKEAYLKAIEKGIINGLNNENCLQDEITHKEKWYLHSLTNISDYQIALCTLIPNCQIKIRELSLNEFK